AFSHGQLAIAAEPAPGSRCLTGTGGASDRHRSLHFGCRSVGSQRGAHLRTGAGRPARRPGSLQRAAADSTNEPLLRRVALSAGSAGDISQRAELALATSAVE